MISNIALMLRPHGRVCMLNVSSFYPGSYTSCHPEWFYSFFAANCFEDVKVYVTVQRNDGYNRFEYKTDLYLYKPYYTSNPDYNHFEAVMSANGVVHSLVLAEAPPVPIDNIVFPINLQYIKSSGLGDWAHMQSRYEMSKRPIMHSEKKSSYNPLQPHLTDHYHYLGTNF